MSTQAIGIFDSGVGGLTVYQALKAILPHENFLYLGDTARVPYGIKTPDTIIHYALQASKKLCETGLKFLVIACNTVTGPALPILKQSYPNLPIIGVIQPGVEEALQISKNKKIAVIATAATVAAHSYEKAIHHLCPTAVVIEKAAGLLVPLAEEGLLSGEIAEKMVHYYLQDLLTLHPDQSPDTLILGCTHFPVLLPVIERVLNKKMKIVNSAAAVSAAVLGYFQSHPQLKNNSLYPGETTFWVSDGIERFTRVAETFLGTHLDASSVHLVDLV